MKYLPCATYRLQFNNQFTFQDAIDIAEYLAELNISHIYASPYLQAKAGSMHGYDVADHTKVNNELSGEKGFAKFYDCLVEKKLGQVIDVVPNHMTTKSPDNKWWSDILRYGRLSPYAEYFDINWQRFAKKQSDKILLPVLEDNYEKVLLEGKIQLRYDSENFSINYFDNVFPVAPISLFIILKNIFSGTQLKKVEYFEKELAEMGEMQIGQVSDIERLKYYDRIKVLEQALLSEFTKMKNV